MEPLTMLFVISSVLASGAFVGEGETDEGISYEIYRDWVIIDDVSSSMEFQYKGNSIKIGVFSTGDNLPSQLTIPILYKVLI